jgi:hypothetical protein
MVVSLKILEDEGDFEESRIINVVLLVLCFFVFALIGYLLANYVDF